MGNSYKMSAKSIHLYRIRIVLLAVVLSFFCGGVFVFSVKVAVTLVIVFLAVLVALIIWLPFLLYKGQRTTIEPNKLILTKQLLYRRIYYVNMEDIRYITLSATPLQRYFNIFTIYIYTTCGRVSISNFDSLPSKLRGFIK